MNILCYTKIVMIYPVYDWAKNEGCGNVKSYASYTVRTLLLTLASLLISVYTSGKSIIVQVFLSASFTLCVLLLIFLIEKILVCFKCFRKYGKYEGVWIEILDTCDRPYSICRLRYDVKRGYVFEGTNYSICMGKSSVNFVSKSVTIDDERVFYTTEGIKNQKTHYKQGWGSFNFCPKVQTTLAKARGCFFDVTDFEPKIHETIMVKYNKAFQQNMTAPPGTKFKKLEYTEIIQYSKSILDSLAIELYQNGMEVDYSAR